MLPLVDGTPLRSLLRNWKRPEALGHGNGSVTASVPVSHEAVRAALEKILGSRTFARSERHSRFLRFVVEETIQGRGDKLKEYLLGMEIFNKRDSFDPHTDPIVRVEACRLRGKLQEYYGSEGAGDPLVIEIPRGGYVPVFRNRQPVGRRGRLIQRRMHFLPVILIPGMLLLLGGGWRFRQSSTNLFREAGVAPLLGAPLSGAAPSIAVLPFLHLRSDKEGEYISDGLTEEIMNALTNVEGLRVVARTSTIPYKGAREDVRQIGSQLNASMVLEGAVQQAANRLRVTAHLVNTADGYRLWSQTYESPLQDVFASQEGIARAIANTLRLKLSGAASRPLAKRYTESLEAHNLYLEGLYHARKRNESGLNTGIAYFQRAASADPEYAPGYAELANAYVLLAVSHLLPPGEAMPKAKAAGEKALRIDETLGTAHAALGMVSALHDWDWIEADRQFQRALELDPGDAGVHAAYALTYLAPLGRLEEALSELRRARTLDPVSPQLDTDLGAVYDYGRQYDKAIAQYRKALDLDPKSHGVYLGLGSSYAQKSMFQEALAAFQKGSGAGAAGPALLGHTYGLMGKRREAKAILEELTALSNRRYVSAYHLALVYLGLGEKSGALDWLEKAAQERSPMLVYLNVNPRFDSLRPEPRFVALLNKLGLPQSEAKSHT